MHIIQHNKPFIGEEEQAAVKKVLTSGWLDQGPEVEGLERDFTFYLGGGNAVALSSGTASLFLGLKLLEVNKGDEVILPTYVCSAVLNAIYMSGAKPVLVDIRESDFNIDHDSVEEVITEKTKAIIVPHIYGFPADLRRLLKSGITIIEDTAQALGAISGKSKVGTIGHLSIFSFYATKIITGGQGGLLFSMNKRLSEKARDYREFDCRGDYYPRFNFKMTDMQAALVRSQLIRLQYFIERRKKISDSYKEVLPPHLRFQKARQDSEPIFYRFVVRFNCEEDRDRLKKYLSENGIQTIIPIERYELLHRYLGLDPAAFPVSEKIVDETLSLPIYPALKDEEISRICELLEKAPV